jgi:sulfur-carrier protein
VIDVRFFAKLRELTGEKACRWEAPAATVGALLDALSAHYGPAFGRAVLAGNELSPAVMVLVNGRDARLQGGVDAPLQPGDTISLFPPLSGG